MPAYASGPADEFLQEMSALPRGTTAAEVAQHLLSHFGTGPLSTGDRVPPERALAEKLGVGRSAVREALAALELLGLVEVRPGAGTYVRGTTSDLLPKTLTWGMLLGEHDTQQLLEVRSALEVESARLAAERADEGAISRLQGNIEAMHEALPDVEEAIPLDYRFHVVLADSCRNTLAADMLRTCRTLLSIWMDRALRSVDDAVESLSEHETILRAVEGHDAEAAEQAMRAHMRTATKRLTAQT
ncbi:FadR/GntR family transcriptional regulator [uncultured Propionibacterium sp.]|uniref:FadR/GntR family transcriptional regulator n=1 Tax=uncultured Propionibacterium sp. TaxID=218066 RepID=UPI00292D1F1C|nr:FadR/GntR family transcriptional regulator [uncultured Propionibacterium sp.]